MKPQITRIVATTLLLFIAIAIDRNVALTPVGQLLLYLVPYLLISYDLLWEAGEGILRGRLPDEHFLMSIATIGALVIGFLPGAESRCVEAVSVMLLFQIGELLEGYGEARSRRAISRLLEIRPDRVRLLRDGGEVELPAEEVSPGEMMIVRPGERVALDGIITEGRSSLDLSALTGESLPKAVEEGDELLSGAVNLSGLLTVKVTKCFGDSTASRIIAMVEESAGRKSRSEAFITRFAHVYTPIVVVGALLLALLPPLLTSFTTPWTPWLYRALTFLVASCPCALVISVPLTFFAGIGGASRRGILIKGGRFVDRLARAGVVVLDKTGTLTEGRFEVTELRAADGDEGRLLRLAAAVERHSHHPIAAALQRACPEASGEATDLLEHSGRGLTARFDGQRVAVGSVLLMEELGIALPEHTPGSGTVVHVAVDGSYLGSITLADRLRSDARDAMARLRELGIPNQVMLTGDREEVAKRTAEALGIGQYHSELLPEGKVTILEEIREETPTGRSVLFVGDGINDAPVLARADVGIAMGALGSDAAIEAADVVLMEDRLDKVPSAIRIARRIRRIARINIVFAIGVKLLVLLLAAFGLATMWMAVFADVGVTLLAVLHALRALRLPER